MQGSVSNHTEGEEVYQYTTLKHPFVISFSDYNKLQPTTFKTVH